jgi:hypothetical protein
VLRGAHVEGLPGDVGQLERLDPDVELEVGSVAPELVADGVPELVDLGGRRQSRPSWGLVRVNLKGERD